MKFYALAGWMIAIACYQGNPLNWNTKISIKLPSPQWLVKRTDYIFSLSRNDLLTFISTTVFNWSVKGGWKKKNDSAAVFKVLTQAATLIHPLTYCLCGERKGKLLMQSWQICQSAGRGDLNFVHDGELQWRVDGWMLSSFPHSWPTSSPSCFLWRWEMSFHRSVNCWTDAAFFFFFLNSYILSHAFLIHSFWWLGGGCLCA